MSAFLAFVTANSVLLLGLAYAFLNLLVAIFKKNERATGILARIRQALEFISGLEPKNSEGTVKLPFKKAGPTKVL